MEILNNNCSSKEHNEIEAIAFCQECKIYMCNKCDNYHSKLFQNHHKFNVKEDIKEIFTGLCKEENHSLKLKYFCKTHNELCCAGCLSKIKDKEYGQHSNCDVCNIDNIKEEKKQNLNKNIKILEELTNNLENTIIHLKQICEKMNKDREELKLAIQKTFTKIRNSLNEREDELLLETDKIFDSIYFKEEIIKECEAMPKVTKQNIDIGKKIDENEWNIENKLNFMINDCIKIENNIEKINKLNENIQKCNSNKNEIIFLPEEKGINDFLEKIKTFGSINKIKKLEVKFLNEVLENEELDTKCKCIIIDNIKIQNIGRETLKNLCFVRDEKESSKDFIIYGSRNINIHNLTPTDEEFPPGKTEDHSIALRINNPEVDQTYNMYLYIRENENGEKLSKPLKIVYKIKEDEEAAIRKREEKEKQREEFEKQKELERQKEVERPKEELERQNLFFFRQKEIEKPKKMINYKNKEEKNIKKKNKYNNKDEIDMEKVKTIYEDLETEYNLSCILEKEQIIAKIIELKCDHNKINDWIDEVM